MGYQIRYGKSNDDKKSCKTKLWYYLALLSMVLAVVLTLCFPGRMRALRRHVFPCFEPEVRGAFAQMVENVDKGMGVKDAAASFCREIVFEEQIQD